MQELRIIWADTVSVLTSKYSSVFQRNMVENFGTNRFIHNFTARAQLPKRKYILHFFEARE